MNRTDPGTAGRSALHAAIVARHAPGQAGMLANTLTFGWRALLKIKHAPEQVFDVVVTPIMFTVMFTFLFGGALAESTDAYLQFLLPGILVQTIMFTTIYTGFTLNTDISRGIFDRFKSMPIWSPAPIVGAMTGDFVRYTTASSLVFVVGLLLGYWPETGVLGFLLTVVLLNVFAFGIGWIFVCLSLLVSTPGTVMTMSWLVLMPLTFASNIYVDPATMPAWLQTVVSVNPVALLVTAARGIMGGTVAPGDIGFALLAPAVIGLLCGPIAMMLYRRER